MKSGTKANHTGNLLENFVESSLIELGYSRIKDYKNQILENYKLVKGKQYIKQMPVGKTIYESTRKCDFMLFNSKRFTKTLIIECKWQQSPGSVDEKYPYLLCNINKTKIPTIILIDGGGYKKTALKWLKGMVQRNEYLIGVWTMNFKKK